MNPVISIIVPVYNVAPYISKCLDSILGQTFTNFEVIVVNDDSTDESGEICERYAKKDRRLKVIHQDYGGVSVARNTGLAAAEGDFIGFVDGDDYVDPLMYEKLHRLCTHTESDIAVCHLTRSENESFISHGPDNVIKEMKQEEALRQLFRGQLYRFSLCNKLFSRTVFKDIYFPAGRIHEDLSTTYKLFANARKSVYSDFTGYIYVKRKNSILTSRFNQERLDAFTGWREIIIFMKTNFSQLLPEVYACFGYWAVDNVYYTINQTDKEEREIYLKQIRQHVNLYYKALMKNELLSVKYKYLIMVINYNINFLVLSRQVRGLFNKKIIN